MRKIIYSMKEFFKELHKGFADNMGDGFALTSAEMV